MNGRKRISELPSASIPLSGNELFEISQLDKGVLRSKKVTFNDINPSAAKPVHNSTLNKQGGAPGEFYHLPQLYHDNLVNDEYTLRTETEAVSANALQQANDYTDTKSAEASGNALNQANDYTDTKSAEASGNALNQANLYTDTEILALSASMDEHNELKNIQGGQANEYYHLTQAIHDGLFSGSPIIGMGNSSGVKTQVDYGKNIVFAGLETGETITINQTTKNIDIHGSDGVNILGDLGADSYLEPSQPDRLRSHASLHGSSDGTEWILHADALPISIQYHGLFAYKGKLWVAGGSNGAVYNNTVYSSIDGINWVLENAAAFPNNGMSQSAYCVYKGAMYMIAGSDATPNYTRVILRSIDGVNWNNVGLFPVNKLNSIAVVFKGSIWILGGNLGGDNGDRSVYKSDYSEALNSLSFTSQGNLLPAPGIVNGNAVVHNDQIFVTGLQAVGSQAYYKSSDGLSWSSFNAPAAGLAVTQLVSYDGKLWTISGDDPWNTRTRKVYFSTDEGSTWLEAGTDSFPNPGTRTNRVTVFQGSIVSVGGVNTEANDVMITSPKIRSPLSNPKAEAGTEALGNAASSVSVVFATAQPDTNYSIACSFVNTVDGGPLDLTYKITAKSAAGFTATFDQPTDSVNYLFDWMIRHH